MGHWESVFFSVIIISAITAVSYFATRKLGLVPGRLQAAAELVVGGLDDFIRDILGPEGRRFTPFIGTLFIYILLMNLLGLVPFMKSPTASLSTTVALAICVFIYVQYTGIKELGFFGYIYHLLGRPKGAMAFTVVIPLFVFFIHLITELIRPVTLSLRLRSNVWGDDSLLGIVAGFGIKGVPLLLFSVFLTIIASIVQALVFSLLTAVYFALIIGDKEKA